MRWVVIAERDGLRLAWPALQGGGDGGGGGGGDGLGDLEGAALGGGGGAAPGGAGPGTEGFGDPNVGLIDVSPATAGKAGQRAGEVGTPGGLGAQTGGAFSPAPAAPAPFRGPVSAFPTGQEEPPGRIDISRDFGFSAGGARRGFGVGTTVGSFTGNPAVAIGAGILGALAGGLIGGRGRGGVNVSESFGGAPSAAAGFGSFDSAGAGTQPDGGGAGARPAVIGAPAPGPAAPPRGGGGGGGGGGSARRGGGSSRGAGPGEEQLLGFAGSLRTALEPFISTLFAQGTEALRTGGVGAKLPMIQQALERSKQATSATIRESEENLSRLELAGTPFGQRLLGRIRQGGQQEARQIPTRIAEETIRLTAGLTPQLTGTTAQAFGAVTGAETTRFSENLRADTARFLGELQARTAIDVANLDAATRNRIADINRSTELDVANMRARAERDARTAQAIGTAGSALGSYSATSGGKA